MPSERMTMTYIDEHLATSTVTMYIPSADATLADSSRVDFREALQELSSASIYQESIVLDQPVSGAPAAAANTYDIADKAILAFKTVVGSVVRISIPAPLASIFINDRVVDATNELVEAVLTAAYTSLTDITGNLVTTFLGGYRDRVKRATT